MENRYLYRAKRIDNGEWVKGNLIWSNDAEVGYEAIIIPTMIAIYIQKVGVEEI